MTAEKGNAENLLIITDYPELIKQYVKNWETRMSKSYKYAVIFLLFVQMIPHPLKIHYSSFFYLVNLKNSSLKS